MSELGESTKKRRPSPNALEPNVTDNKNSDDKTGVGL